MTIPIEWVLTLIVGLGGTVSTLAAVLWSNTKALIAKQDRKIESQEAKLAHQDGVIDKLQDDVERLSRGCGHAACVWKTR